jgi:hypothetical protein
MPALKNGSSFDSPPGTTLLLRKAEKQGIPFDKHRSEKIG